MRLGFVQNQQKNSCSKFFVVVECTQEDHRVRSVCPLPCGAVRAVLTEPPWTAARVDLWRFMQVQPWFLSFQAFFGDRVRHRPEHQQKAVFLHERMAVTVKMDDSTF